MENPPAWKEIGKEEEEEEEEKGEEKGVVGHDLTMINVFEDGATCSRERPEGE